MLPFQLGVDVLAGDLDTLDVEPDAPDPTPEPSASSGGWWGLLSIAREAAQLAADAAARDPEACPNDGEPLVIGPRGELHCPFDGWTPR